MTLYVAVRSSLISDQMKVKEWAARHGMATSPNPVMTEQGFALAITDISCKRKFAMQGEQPLLKGLLTEDSKVIAAMRPIGAPFNIPSDGADERYIIKPLLLSC